MLMYIACLRSNLVSVHFYTIPKLFIYLYTCNMGRALEYKSCAYLVLCLLTSQLPVGNII